MEPMSPDHIHASSFPHLQPQNKERLCQLQEVVNHPLKARMQKTPTPPCDPITKQIIQVSLGLYK